MSGTVLLRQFVGIVSAPELGNALERALLASGAVIFGPGPSKRAIISDDKFYKENLSELCLTIVEGATLKNNFYHVLFLRSLPHLP